MRINNILLIVFLLSSLISKAGAEFNFCQSPDLEFNLKALCLKRKTILEEEAKLKELLILRTAAEEQKILEQKRIDLWGAIPVVENKFQLAQREKIKNLLLDVADISEIETLSDEELVKELETQRLMKKTNVINAIAWGSVIVIASVITRNIRMLEYWRRPITLFLVGIFSANIGYNYITWYNANQEKIVVDDVIEKLTILKEQSIKVNLLKEDVDSLKLEFCLQTKDITEFKQDPLCHDLIY